MAKARAQRDGVIMLARAWRPYLLPSLAVTFIALAVLVVSHRFERLLIEDSRFQMRGPELGEQTSPDMRLAGVDRTSPPQVRAVFRADEGRSVYLIPLEKRRERLLELKWVKTASVSRIWPGRVDVRIAERIPVAFVQVTPDRRGAPVSVQLIDIDGQLLPVGEGRKHSLPLLTGIRERHTRVERAARVRLMLRLLSELGELGKPISEIDVSEPSDIKVIYPTDDRALTLVLGGEEWKPRIEKFIRHYPDVKKKMPKAIKLDLRLRDRITALAVDESEDGG